MSHGGWWWPVLSLAGCGVELSCCVVAMCSGGGGGGSNGGCRWLLVVEVTEWMWVVVAVDGG